MSRFDVYQVDDALCLSHCLFLSLLSFCSPTHSPTYQSFTHPLILFLTLLLYFSLPLSLVCTCVRECVSSSPSFSCFRPCIRLRLSVFLFFALLHTLSRTRSHTLSLIHSLTNAHTHQFFILIFLAHSHTFLSLSLSFSLFLSLSLLHTYTDTHTFALTLSLTYSLAHPLIHYCRVCVLRCLQRAYARALSSLCFFPPSSLSYSFAFQFCLFYSLPPLSLACYLAVFLSLVCFLSFSTPGSHDFNLKQSCSHCECILSLSCPWCFLSDRTVEEKNRGRDKLMRQDRDLLVSTAKFPYILSYTTDGNRLLQIGSAPVRRLLQTLFAYCRESLIIYIYA